jgi:hypothetical protein
MPIRYKINVDLGIGSVSELNEFKDQAVFREMTRIRQAIINLAQAVSSVVTADYDSDTDTLSISIIRGNAATDVLVLRAGDINAIGIREVSGEVQLGFFSEASTPIAQPTTAIAPATINPIGGTTIGANDEFDGYTLAQVVKALRDLGLLA